MNQAKQAAARSWRSSLSSGGEAQQVKDVEDKLPLAQHKDQHQENFKEEVEKKENGMPARNPAIPMEQEIPASNLPEPAKQKVPADNQPMQNMQLQDRYRVKHTTIGQIQSGTSRYRTDTV